MWSLTLRVAPCGCVWFATASGEFRPSVVGEVGSFGGILVRCAREPIPACSRGARIEIIPSRALPVLRVAPHAALGVRGAASGEDGNAGVET